MPDSIRRLLRLLRLLPTLAGLLVLIAGGTAIAAPPLVFAVHPYLAAGEIEHRFTPLVKHLVAATGRDIVIRVPRDYDERINVVGRDDADIAYIGPAGLVALERKYGARPLLGRLEVAGKASLHGHIVVRHDSPIRTLADLRGKRMAFGDPQSTMSFLVPRAVLKAAGIGDRDFLSIGSLGNHDNIASAVLAGDFDAGAIKDETFAKYARRGLRSLQELPHVADHAFVASRRLPAETVARLRSALTGLQGSESGRAILRNIQANLTAVVPAQSNDYNSLRRLLSSPGRSGNHQP